MTSGTIAQTIEAARPDDQGGCEWGKPVVVYLLVQVAHHSVGWQVQTPRPVGRGDAGG